ncbi:MAG: SpoIIE family protein phosphatase [Clostridia bacterium]|nr:SpoIIE family protein phosphatase [Clostridia bacterium]
MSVSQAIRVASQRREAESFSRLKSSVIKQFLSFVGGLLFSFAGFSDNFSPFGIAFACGMPSDMLISATAGNVLGCFLALDSVSALRYTASALAMAVIMLSLKSLGDLHKNPVVRVIVAFATLFVTGFAVALADGLSALNILLCFSESVIGGASAFVFFRSVKAFGSVKGLSTASSRDATAFVVACTLLLLSISSFEIYGVYPAHIIAGVLILVCGFYARASGGAIVGVCAGVTMALTGEGNTISLFFPLGGLLCGVFSRFGKVACALGFAFSGLAVTVLSYGAQSFVPLVIETALALVLFFLITYRFSDSLERLLVPAVTSPVIESVKSDIVSRLRRAANYSTEICTSVSAVNDALNNSKGSDFTDVIKKTRNKVCGSCGLYESCWRESAEATVQHFNTLLDLKKNGVYLESKTVPQGFSSTCIRSESISSSFNRLYSEYKVRYLSESRMREMYSLAAEQFVNVAQLLESLSDSIHKSVRFDMDTAAQIRVVAAECGFAVVDCVCVLNNTDKMKIELHVGTDYKKESLLSFNDRLESVVNRRLDLPEVENYDSCVKLIYKELPDYKIIHSAVQYNANNEKYSGDSYSCFTDSDGYFYAVICDGMGTGTRAAITSSLAVSLLEKLVKAGFGIESVIRTVNTCLISKSGDECSSSLDLMCVDLYTGHAEFYKCGASDTLVKKRSKIVDVGFRSMPLGILGECDIGCGTGYLDSGDVIVLCSDGVRTEDYYDIRQAMKSFNGGSVKDFCEGVAESVRKKQPEKKDDMTLITLALIKN